MIGSVRKTLIGSSSGPALQATEVLKKTTIDVKQPHVVLDLKDETLMQMKADTLDLLFGVHDAEVAGRHDHDSCRST